MNLPLRHLLSLLLIFIGATSCAWSEETAQVLLLNSYHYGMDWTDGETSGVQEVVKQSGRPVELHVEYMDTKRISDAAHLDNLRQLLEYKYRDIRLAGILATDNDAFNFLRRYRDTLFPGVPVVFAGVNFFRDEMLEGFGNCTGVAETFEGVQTIALMRQLHPQTRRIVVILDATTTGNAIREESEAILQPYAGQVKFELWDNQSLNQLRERLPKLDSDTLVLLMPFARDSAGTYISYADIAKLVSQYSSVPVYGAWDFYLGYGIVGGRLTNAAAQGHAAADILLRVLAGEDVNKIPVTRVAPTEFQFDARQLRRYGIPTSALPAGSQVLFQSWFELYQTWIWLGGLLATIVLFLSWNWVRSSLLRRRSEMALKASEERYGLILQHSPMGILHYDANLKITYCNDRLSQILNVPKNKLIGLDMNTLKDQRVLPALRTVFEGKEGKYEGEYVATQSGVLRSVAITCAPFHDSAEGGEGGIAIVEDISTRKAFEAELTATKESLALSVHGADLALADWDIRNDRLSFGEGWTKLLGYDAAELPPRSTTLTPLIRQEDLESVRAILVRHLKNETPIIETELRLRHKDGHWVWVHARGMVVERGEDGRAVRLAGTAMDVSARKQAEAEIARLSNWNELLLNSAGEGIYGVDLEGGCTFINPAALAMLGYEREDIMAKYPHDVFHHHHVDGSPYPANDCPVFITLRDGVRRQTEDAFMRKNGQAFPVQMTVTPMHENGRIVGVEIVFQDIARRKAMEAELLRLATTDSLTGMANRRRFLDQAAMELARMKRFGGAATLLMIDIDHFKRINDTYGHAVGDTVLQHFAEVCRLGLRNIDVAGRLGGEEFGILLPGTDGTNACLFAERVRAYVADTPAQTSKGAVAFTVSIGIAAFSSTDATPDSIMVRADAALYWAKEGGRNAIKLYALTGNH